MMGAFQGAFTKIVGGAMAGKLMAQKSKDAMQNVEDIKMAKLKQRAQKEKLRAQIEKSKLAKIQAKQKTVELKAKQKADKEQVRLNGQLITDQSLLSKVKEANK